jgi:uncharacterized protein YegP (UPF0339 family)
MSTRKTVFEVLKNSAGRWFWHERAGNGKIMNVAQAYSRKSGALAAAKSKASRTANSTVKVLGQ